jgi:hypothetical protein
MSREARFVSQQRRPNKPQLLLIVHRILRRQCHPTRIRTTTFYFSALSDPNVKLHATLLPILRTGFLLFVDTVIRTACLRTPFGVQYSKYYRT